MHSRQAGRPAQSATMEPDAEALQAVIDDLNARISELQAISRPGREMMLRPIPSPSLGMVKMR